MFLIKLSHWLPNFKSKTDIADAYKLVDSSVENIKSIREKIDEIFSSWYNSEIIPLADNIIGVSECVPRKTSLQRNRSNVPSNTPMEHYKRAMAIPLLDSLLGQMKERFSDMLKDCFIFYHLL